MKKFFCIVIAALSTILVGALLMALLLIYGLPTLASYRSNLLLSVFGLVIVLAGGLACSLAEVVKLLSEIDYLKKEAD